MNFNIQTAKGPKPSEGEYVEMHGVGLVFSPVRGGFNVSHYATGFRIGPLDAIAGFKDPVGFQEAKDGVANMFAVHSDLRAKIVAATAGKTVLNVLPLKERNQ